MKISSEIESARHQRMEIVHVSEKLSVIPIPETADVKKEYEDFDRFIKLRELWKPLSFENYHDDLHQKPLTPMQKYRFFQGFQVSVPICLIKSSLGGSLGNEYVVFRVDPHFVNTPELLTKCNQVISGIEWRQYHSRVII